MRSRIFAERGIVDVLFANELSSEKLAARIVANLEQTDSTVQDEPGIDTDGANYVARLFAERTRHSAKALPSVPNAAEQGLRLPVASSTHAA
jgi:predicted glycosyltransferase